jgi:hypothetical protein
VTGPDEQARRAFTAKDHVEFEAAATTSPARFLKEKYGREITDFDSPSEFVATTAGEGDPSGPSHPNSDDVAEQAMTVTERVDLRRQITTARRRSFRTGTAFTRRRSTIRAVTSGPWLNGRRVKNDHVRF